MNNVTNIQATTITFNTLFVELRNVYGNEMIYPACDDSKRFAKLTGTKTLSRRDIDVIKELGYKIQVVAPTL